MEFRYYQMPAGSPILALLGKKWRQNYGRDIDYLHFHNYLEIGFCYEGTGDLILGEDTVGLEEESFQSFRRIFHIPLTVIREILASGSICLSM